MKTSLTEAPSTVSINPEESEATFY